MLKSKNTKRALLTSVLLMVLSLTLLIGSTFAWFTDSVTSSNNKIVAGNLDVELEYATFNEDGSIKDWKSVEGVSLFDENVLWEPGYTQVVYLKVRNAGTLALKYKFSVNVIAEISGTNVKGDSFNLSDYLVFGQVVTSEMKTYATREDAWDAVGNTRGLKEYSNESTLNAKEEEYIALVVYMPTIVENEANYRGNEIPSIELGINLIATQTPFESDSYGNQYDAGVEYPVTTQADFVQALNSAKAGDTLVLTDGVYELPTANYQITDGIEITGKEGTVLTVDAAKNGDPYAQTSNSGMLISGNNVTISNVTIIGENIGSNEYDAFVRISGNNVTLENVTINSTTNSSPIIISSTDGENNTITIKNCNITSYFKGIHITDGASGTINIEECNINAVYPFNVNTNSKLNINVTDSVLNGWTSYGKTVSKVVFKNCEFGIGHGYGYVVAYADTDFINCKFAEGFDPLTKNNNNKTMTFTDCYKNEIKITPENVKEEFYAKKDSDSIGEAHGWTVIVNGVTVETNPL